MSKRAPRSGSNGRHNNQIPEMFLLGGPSGSQPNKKPKISGGSTSSSHQPRASARGFDTSSRGSSNSSSVAETSHHISCAPDELVESVKKSITSHPRNAEGLICGAINDIRKNRIRPNQTTVVNILILSKSHPHLFTREEIFNSLAALLMKDEYVKTKVSSIVSVVACTILGQILNDNYDWPLVLVKVFLEDSMGDRLWVDLKDCRSFVSNIITAFRTKCSEELMFGEKNFEDKRKVINRFQNSISDIHKMTADLLRDRIAKRQNDMPPNHASINNLLKTIITCCGIKEVREVAMGKMDTWLQYKNSKPANDLLMAICQNCNTHTQEDVDVIKHLTRLKKSRPINFIITCLKELVRAHPENHFTLVTHLIYMELSAARSIINIPMINGLVQEFPIATSKYIGIVCQNLLLEKDDKLRNVRLFVRELFRTTRYELEVLSFAKGLLKMPDMEKYGALEGQHKDRFISSSCDVICMLMLLSVTAQVKEALSVVNGRKAPAPNINHELILSNFRRTIADVQQHTLWWMHEVVLLKLATRELLEYEYAQHIYRHFPQVVFLKAADTYHTKDNWPPEAERGMLVKACYDVTVSEDSIMRIAAICRTSEYARLFDGLDMINQLIKRSASIASITQPDYNPLPFKRQDLLATILDMCQYRVPGHIELPRDYLHNYSLVISQHFWSIMPTFLILAAFNPSTIGEQAWNEYPTLRHILEMAISNRFSYPPVAISDVKERSELIALEQQASLAEKHHILEMEAQLAAVTTRQTINEQNSLLLAQLMSSDFNVPRRPPDKCLEQLAAVSQQLHLGVRLCRSRDPDYLLKLMQRYDDDETIPWLCDLVVSTKGDVSAMNVQFICQLIISYDEESKKKLSGIINRDALILYLRGVLLGDDQDDAVAVQEYFLKKLASSFSAVRKRALQGLSPLLHDIHLEEAVIDFEAARSNPYRWLLVDLPRARYYQGVLQTKAIEEMKMAMMVEDEPCSVAAYFAFLKMQVEEMLVNLPLPQSYQLISSIAVSTATLIYQRQVLITSVLDMTNKTLLDDNVSVAQSLMSSLLYIMSTHLKTAIAQEPTEAEILNEKDGELGKDKEELYIQWKEDNHTARLFSIVQHSMILLLSYGPPSRYSLPTSLTGTTSDDDYLELMKKFVKQEGDFIPQVWIIDENDEGKRSFIGTNLIEMGDRARILANARMNSSTEPLIRASLSHVKVEELVMFIQSFGIPLDTMNYLFQFLDSVPVEQLTVVYEAMKNHINVDYFIKFAEVQKMRNCKGGAEFLQFFESCKQKEEGSSDTATKMDTIGVDSSPICKIVSADNSHREEDDVTPMDDDDVIVIEEDVTEQLKKSFSQGADLKVWRLYISSFNSMNCDEKKLLNTIQSLDTQLRQSPDFLDKFVLLPSRACSLLRSIDRCMTSSKGKGDNCEAKNLFKTMMSYLHSKCKERQQKQGGDISPLVNHLSSWIARHRRDSVDNSTSRRRTSSSDGNPPLVKHHRKLERHFKQLSHLNNDEKIKEKVLHVAEMLLSEIGHQQELLTEGRSLSDDNCLVSVGTTGLLIDWLQLLDPELLAQTPTLQRKLLFESTGTDMMRGATSYDQTYLLSLLREYCNWSGILKTIHWLLSDSTPDPTAEVVNRDATVINPKTALDFLWVVIQAPMLWQGRENKSTSMNEPVMKLDLPQACRLLSYVVAATRAQRVHHQDEDQHDHDKMKRSDYLDNLGTLFSKFGQDLCSQQHISDIIQFARGKISSSSTSSFQQVWWEALALLYIMKPNVPIWNEMQLPSFDPNSEKSFYYTDLLKFTNTLTNVSAGASCHTDALICSLINRVGYVQASSTAHGKVGSGMHMASVDSAVDASLLLLKIGSWRPFLLLRQMPMLCAMVRGRTRFDFQEFKGQHHLPLTLNLLYLLLQLSSHILNPQYENQVNDLMEILWQVMKNYCHKARRQLKPVMLRTLMITHHYIYSLPHAANQLLSKHLQTLQSLIHSYSDSRPCVEYLQSVYNSLAPTGGRNNEAGGENPQSWTMSRRPYLPPPPTILDIDEQCPTFGELLHEQDDVALLKIILNEFEDNARRKEIDDVTQFVPQLSQILLKTRDPGVRKIAMTILLRHARAQPDSAICQFIFDVYISLMTGKFNRALDPYYHSTRDKSIGLAESNMDSVYESFVSDRSHSVHLLFEFLPDVAILCRENAIKLLGAAFDAGCRSAVNLPLPPSSCVEQKKNKTYDDLSDLLSRSLWGLSGISQSDALQTAPSSSPS